MGSDDSFQDYQHAVKGTREQPRRWDRASRADGVVIISNDSHVGPPLSELRPYCPKRFLGDFDQFAAEVGHHAFREVVLEFPPENLAVEQFLGGAEPLIHYDPHVRLHHMDEDGITAEVMFHGTANGAEVPFLSGVHSLSGEPWASGQHGAELAHAGIRIYNRWLADFCSVAPDRYLGLAYLPMWDVDLAVQEVELARSIGLRGGVNFPSPRPSLRSYNDASWDPLWAACAAMEMPLHSHVGNTEAMMKVSTYDGVGALQLLMLDMGLFSRRAIPFMILGGVFERHPELKLILTEQATSWVPQMVHDLDGVVTSEFYAPLPLSKKPSEYFWSNVFIGASFMSNGEALTAVADGSSHNVMWGRDYPHREGTWPYTKYAVRKTMEGVPEDAARRMLGLNSIGFYGLDPATVQAIADEVGPSIDEVLTPLGEGELPSGSRFTSAFRRADQQHVA